MCRGNTRRASEQLKAQGRPISRGTLEQWAAPARGAARSAARRLRAHSRPRAAIPPAVGAEVQRCRRRARGRARTARDVRAGGRRGRGRRLRARRPTSQQRDDGEEGRARAGLLPVGQGDEVWPRRSASSAIAATPRSRVHELRRPPLATSDSGAEPREAIMRGNCQADRLAARTVVHAIPVSSAGFGARVGGRLRWGNPARVGGALGRRSSRRPIARGRSGWRARSERAGRDRRGVHQARRAVHRRVAGKRISIYCTELVETDANGFGGSNTGGSTFRAPKRRRKIRTGDLTRGLDYCRVWLAARTVKRRGKRRRYWRKLIVSVPLTQTGAVHLDEESKSSAIWTLLLVAGLETDDPKAYPTPAQLLEALRKRNGVPASAIVALARPTDTPQAGSIGYYSNGREHVARSDPLRVGPTAVRRVRGRHPAHERGGIHLRRSRLRARN